MRTRCGGRALGIVESSDDMQRYRHAGADTGVTAFESGPDYIRVEFRGGRVYRYSYARAGRIHVEEMKRLAEEGRGLSTYISRNVHDLYDRET